MNIRMRNTAVAVCAVAWLSLTGAKATTVIPPTFEEMADRADLVFVGKAVGSSGDWRAVGPNRVNFTLVEIETEEVLKGNAGAPMCCIDRLKNSPLPDEREGDSIDDQGIRKVIQTLCASFGI